MMGCMPRESLFRPFWSRLPCDRAALLSETSELERPLAVCRLLSVTPSSSQQNRDERVVAVVKCLLLDPTRRTSKPRAR